MGKAETNKQRKLDSLLNSAFELFTSNGITKTSVSEIADRAGVAKGTFYLYFRDKYDVRNRLISRKSAKIFRNALNAYEATGITDFEDKLIFIVNHIINQFKENPVLLNFISKNLSWGIFKTALISDKNEENVDFEGEFNRMLADAGFELDNPEIMLFMIIELVSSTCYSAILYGDPADVETLKPYLFRSIRSIIRAHRIVE